MPVLFTQGDLFATPDLHAFAHGCTCTGSMDAGVGLAFKKRWPQMAEQYRALCADRRFHLGDVFVWSEGDVTVYNLAVQENWKSRAKLAALKHAIEHMVQIAPKAGVRRIGLPRIGSGLGGLDWSRVRSVFEEVGAKTDVELVVFDKFVRATKP